jgi:hypothetical protein
MAKSHGVEMVGDFLIEEVATLPTFESKFKRRLLFVTADGKLYYGKAGGWQELTQGYANSFISASAADVHAGTITPLLHNTINLGSNDKQYAEVHAVSFEGVAVDATYSDLAERYITPEHYPEGTLVRITDREDCDVEITKELTDDVIGVISLAPGFLMNAKGDGQPVALVGKVPVRMIGKIKKGQAFMSCATAGCGRRYSFSTVMGNVQFKMGYALENKETEEEGLIMCLLKR